MAKAKQLTVSCENRPGTLAQVARTLGEAKVNIRGFQVGSLGTEGRVRLLVDKVEKAKKALTAAGLSFTEEAVLHVELADKPGGLGAFAGKLAAQGINVDYGYTSAAGKGRKAGVVLGVSDLEKAARIR